MNGKDLEKHFSGKLRTSEKKRRNRFRRRRISARDTRHS